MVRTSETACGYNQGKHLLKPDSPTNKYSQIHAGTITSLLKMKKERIGKAKKEKMKASEKSDTVHLNKAFRAWSGGDLPEALTG